MADRQHKKRSRRLRRRKPGTGKPAVFVRWAALLAACALAAGVCLLAGYGGYLLFTAAAGRAIFLVLALLLIAWCIVRPALTAERRKRRHRPRPLPRHYRRPGADARTGDLQRLALLGLPVLNSRQDLAAYLGLKPGELIWLTGVRHDSGREHYRTWTVPKRSGGVRLLSSPLPKLKRVQRIILRDILSRLHVDDAAHGFTAGRSVVTHAAPHMGREVVVTLDLEDFFGSVTYRRVRGVFQRAGYSKQVAADLALLCTRFEAHQRPLRRRVGFFRRRPAVKIMRHRVLPQGAPTSPALANLVCRRLDRRLCALAAKFGAAYTRYADDLAFSGDRGFELALGRFFNRADRVIRHEEFRVRWEKRRVRRKGGRQQITGVVVNRTTTLPRPERRRLRAMVHHFLSTGSLTLPQGVVASDPVAWLEGRLAYYRMLDPVKGERLWREFRERRTGGAQGGDSKPPEPGY